MNTKRILSWLLILVAPLITVAQQTTQYPNDYLSPEFHAGRRAAFKEKLSANGVGIFFASQVRVRTNDVDFQYAQNKNFYYFTGLEESDALLLLFKQPITILNKTGTEFIFVKNRDPQKELWTGKILGAEGVKAKYKIENVFINDEFTANAVDFSSIDSVFSAYRGEDIFSKYKRAEDPLARMALIVDSIINSQNKPIAAKSTQTILSNLRGIKQPEEIALIAKAAAISCEGHNDVMRAIKPGMTEYQAQAIMEYHFKTNGSEYPGYPSINGAAENACVLHYITNLKMMNTKKIPSIMFTKGGGLWLEDQLTAGADALGLDWQTDIGIAKQKVGKHVALQGNLDPAILLSKPEAIEKEVIRILDGFGHGSGHIFNLGHGITEHTPPEHVEVMLNKIRNYSPQFHA
jgi:Xaa-Pro aminopeptidase